MRHLLLVIPFILLGCGGGEDRSSGSTASSEAEGLWVGTTSDNRTVTGLVLDDGTYYVFYSEVSNPTLIAGVVQGNGSAGSGNFTSTNGKDFNLEGTGGVFNATISGSYTARTSLNGVINYDVVSRTFTSAFDSAYNQTPLTSSVAGTFTGPIEFPLFGGENGTVTVANNGTFSGAGASGCEVSGSITPRSKGNVFNFSLTFGVSPCRFPSATLSGIAYFDSTAKRLYAAAPTINRNMGMVFVSTKP